jgi:hypothetical protein
LVVSFVGVLIGLANSIVSVAGKKTDFPSPLSTASGESQGREVNWLWFTVRQ